MVIECTECRTRFRMADDKLKPGGTKVRCTKCKQIFTVHPPAEDDEDTFASPGAMTLGDLGSPPPQRQAVAPDEGFSFGDTPPTTTFAADDQTEEQEDPFSSGSFTADFSFDDGDSATGDAAFSLGTTTDEGHEAAEESFSFAADDADSTLTFDEGAAPSLSFDFALDGQESGLKADGGASFSDDGGRDDEAAADAGEFNLSLDESGDFSWQEQQAAAEPPEEEGEDDYDFSGMTFGADEPEETPSSRSAPPFASPRAESFAPPPPAGGSTQPAIDEFFDDEPFPEQPVRRSFPWTSLLLLPLMLIAGAAGYFYWADGALDPDRIIARFGGNQAQAVPPGQVRLADLRGAFMEHSHLGQLFVIHGRTVNDFQETRSAIAVKGVLYNDSGKSLLQQTVFAGNPLDEAALRTLSLDKIEEHMNNQFGDSLSNLNIAPGKSIPFTIVFKNLPADLAEFTVEVVDSKPVSR